MQKHDYIKISGYVSITVDSVDLEQIGIEMPGIADSANYVRAFEAAQRKEGFKELQRELMKSNSTLESDDYKIVGGGKIETIFIIRAMMPSEEEAAA